MVKAVLHSFFRQMKGPGFGVTYPDGTDHAYGSGPAAFRLILRSTAFGPRLLASPELVFGEAYMQGQIDIEGDLDALFQVAYASEAATDDSKLVGWWRRLLARIPVTSALQRRNVAYHYDLGNDFYRLWLDPTLSYTCAYFESPEYSLEQAQTAKVDHILRKLNLRPGERLLDIGCGWGGLILQAARKYGARAVGITLSKEQHSACQELIREHGLTGQAEVRILNYRDLPGTGESFDKVTTVGMMEHLGRAQIREFLAIVKKAVRPGGLYLLHTITRRLESPVSPFIARYIFPGGYIPSWREAVAALSDHNLRLLDMEDLRPHYVMTLERWRAGFEAGIDQVRALYGEPFVRMWSLYLYGAAASFRYGSLHVHQFLCSHGLPTSHPMTRSYQYSEPVPALH